uniref:Alpha 1,3-galactosyltransferase 2 n=1 Tax=Neogobius melanostomus TaxID=47308 RepID=A0A8C6TH48_9GOBI
MCPTYSVPRFLLIWHLQKPSRASQFDEMSLTVSMQVRRLFCLCCLFMLGVCLTSLYMRKETHFFNAKTKPKSVPVTVVTMNDLDNMLNYKARSAVQTQTDWKAPIMWEGIWEPLDYDRIHTDNKTSVALTVFAVGRYLEAYLETFLVSAEKHFMIGLPVMYYVFTERPDDVPQIDLAPHRYLRVIRVERHSRWQDISMMRMKTISELIDSEMKYLFSHVFCFDVDQRFMGRFGSEALGESVALLHAHYYKLPKNRFTYDRNPKSKAYMEIGDYYYHAAIFGGSWESVKAIADACLASIIEDKQNDVEALWHDESHLNKYFWIHKPSKLLSPEYCWDMSLNRKDIFVTRLIWAPKDYNRLRVPKEETAANKSTAHL